VTFNPTAHMSEWVRYMDANARAHADYMRWRASCDLPTPDEVVPHGPNSDTHSCKRPQCRMQNRAYNREWTQAKRAKAAA
jgi:hypothetical protein